MFLGLLQIVYVKLFFNDPYVRVNCGAVSDAGCHLFDGIRQRTGFDDPGDQVAGHGNPQTCPHGATVYHLFDAKPTGVLYGR